MRKILIKYDESHGETAEVNEDYDRDGGKYEGEGDAENVEYREDDDRDWENVEVKVMEVMENLLSA